jgi:hypothetical protein
MFNEVLVMKKTFYMMVLGLIFLSPSLVKSELSEEKIKKITQELQKELPNWTENDTTNLLQEAKSGEISRTIMTDPDKGATSIKVIGETILLNGKDITGNLGSKTTHGNYSPIIEEVNNSQIAIGSQNKLRNETKNTNVSLNIFLSIAFPISFASNIFFVVKLLKARKKPN